MVGMGWQEVRKRLEGLAHKIETEELGLALTTQADPGVRDRRDQLRRDAAILRRALGVIARHEDCPRAHPRRGTIDPSSNVGLAVEVIRAEQRAMSADEIRERLRVQYGRQVSRNTLTSALAKLVRAKRVFSQPGRGRYFLIEFADLDDERVREED